MFIRRNIQRPDFRQMIEQNTDEIRHKLISSDDDNILNQTQYRALEVQYIKKLWVGLRDTKLIIYINLTEIQQLEKCGFETFKERIIKQVSTNNKILINHELDIVDAENYTHDLNYKAQEISQNKIVFYFEENGVSVYSNGKNIRTSIFYEDKDFIDHSNRKPISQLDEVLTNYRKHHLKQNESIFFEKSEIIKKYDLSYNTLKSVPEDAMKEDLKNYLTKNLQYTFTKNVPINDSGQRIDVYTVAEDKLYFITIEWLGQSISECKTRIDDVHNELIIEKSIVRTMRSMESLKISRSNNVERCYLALFDAREYKSNINVNQFYHVINSKDNLSCFTMLDTFEINNSNIS